ncbi:hypothetical protein IW140_000087 [Coemansia sp. RSA 1813]|nr:hypothetical protein EV178_000110 [Coemansia sp. RSA 1646]KAJ1771474.1 hypothetical protein LPJ74_002294 [Coemansia sp. RSA 1843]KAJ2093191.1 hypothetical protein IW138_000484 [Coemansia sp. RSA 986]KAJ2217544.1 hypothetical protein EV179_000378 [Coemansia sp. RSA 487]KAJ2573445.1 hypothetical protein IW140_000087 [Coemansia sp. RSA 1813]
MTRYSIVSMASAAAMALVSGPRLVLGACGFDSIDVTTTPGFTLTTNDDYKVLEDTVAKTKYGLYCDSQPSGVNGIDKWFKVPVESVGIRVPVASGFLEILRKSKAIAAAEDPSTLTNICVDTSSLATLNSSSTVDVVFSSDANSDGDKSVRLPSDDSLTPLQKAEWVKFVSAFFNEEKTANTLFSSIADAYDCHRGNLQHLASAPHVYWVQYTENDSSHDDKPTYNIIDTAYQKEILAASGVTNDNNAPPSDATDQAAFQAAVADAQFVFDQSNLTEYGMRASEWYHDFGYTDAQNSDAVFLEQRSIWRTDKYTNKNGVSNFPEFAYVRPDLVLQDLISVIEPTYNSSYTKRWMLWLGGTSEATVTIDSENYNCAAPWLVQVTACSARTDFTGDESSASSSSDKEGDESSDHSGSSSRAGKIAGGVIGALAVVILAFVALHYFNRHRQRARIRALSGASGFGGESIGLHDTRPRVYS